MINWESLYYHLLETKQVKEGKIGEKHHILPKHDGGDKNSPTVTLKHRDHMLAHYIRYRWKNQLGDRLAYKMMSGQVVNPMHDPEALLQHRAYMKSDKVRANSSKSLKASWSNPVIAQKLKNSRKQYIDNLENTNMLTRHLQSKEVKKKAQESLKVYRDTVDRRILSKIGKKAATTLKTRYTSEEISKWRSQPGSSNSKWKGSYSIDNGIEEIKFETKVDLQKKMRVDFYVIDKYANTGKPVKMGNLKGYKIHFIEKEKI